MNEVKRSGAGRPKSEEKRHQIIMAGVVLFLKKGFNGTSMDMVANEAGVSKQTVYSHFSNKDALFTAVIDFKCTEYRIDAEHIEKSKDDPQQVFHLIGEQFVELLQDPKVVAMYKVVVGESVSNSHTAELFYEAGPKQAMKLLENYLATQQQFPISQDKARVLSMVFFNMLKGEFHMKSLLGLPHEMSKEQKQAHVKTMVRWALVCLQDASENP